MTEISQTWEPLKIKGWKSLANDYVTLNGIPEFNDVTNSINTKKNNVILNDGSGPSGGSETGAGKYFNDLSSGIKSPDIDVYVKSGDAVDKSLLEKGKANGAYPNVSYSEINAMFWENVLRNRASLPLRLYYTPNISTNRLEAPANIQYGIQIVGGKQSLASPITPIRSINIVTLSGYNGYPSINLTR